MTDLKIDLNCDLGESYGRFRVGHDDQIMPWITSCNIACGFHGGDPLTIQKTIELALKHQVQIGAHPSYPDLSGFGRRKMEIPIEELKSIVVYQISALKGMVESVGGRLKHVKPHGALYNVMTIDPIVAKCLMEATISVDPTLFFVGPAGRDWDSVAKSIPLPYVRELFSDRNYHDDLTLVSRQESDAMILDVDSRIQHVNRMVLERKVRTIEGNIKEIEGETVCIHGDHSLALETAKKLHSSLIINEVIISPFAKA